MRSGRGRPIHGFFTPFNKRPKPKHHHHHHHHKSKGEFKVNPWAAVTFVVVVTMVGLVTYPGQTLAVVGIVFVIGAISAVFETKKGR
jgi:hypothetical protein